jgi:tetratricopeptide (TPR) repeat protein
MKNYVGVNDDDKPKNGGSYVDENEYAHECYNFLDYNGKCYGFVMLNGNLNLELHFKQAKKNQDFLKDVLVVWVSTNDTNETRIVGWYKNATVYREGQYVQAFTNSDFDLFYRIEALAKDCYLLPEQQRTFPIQRAAQTGKGTGMGRSNVWYADSSFAKTVLVPKVIDYIDDYNGEFANSVSTDEILNEVMGKNCKIDDYQSLYDEGIKNYDNNSYWEALKFFNTARNIKETPEVVLGVAKSLFSMNCFNKAIPLFKKLVESGENTVEAVKILVSCYDYIGDRKNTIKYCEMLLELLDDSEDRVYEKMFINCVLFYIHILLRDKKNAKGVVDKIIQYSNDEKVKNSIKEMKAIIKKEFNE